MKSRLLLYTVACAFLVVTAFLAAEAPAQTTPSKTADAAPKPAATTTASEPEHVVVQHILIGFKGSVPGKEISRTKEEAAKLADQILSRAQKGEDFDKLVKEYTADSAPGIYGMANNGIRPGSAESPRAGMVKAFGDVSFSLKVGEIGMTHFDPQASKYGWHIIKRLK